MNGEADNSRMYVCMHLAFKELIKTLCKRLLGGGGGGGGAESEQV